MKAPSFIERKYHNRYLSILSVIKEVLSKHLGDKAEDYFIEQEADQLHSKSYSMANFIWLVCRSEDEEPSSRWDGKTLDLMIQVLSPTRDARIERYFIDIYHDAKFEAAIRETAVKALSDFRSEESAQALLRALQEDAEDVPFFAQVSLASMGNFAIPYLVSHHMQGKPVYKTSGGIAWMLEKMQTPLSTAILDLLKKGELEYVDRSEIRNKFTHFYD